MPWDPACESVMEVSESDTVCVTSVSCSAESSIYTASSFPAVRMV